MKTIVISSEKDSIVKLLSNLAETLGLKYKVLQSTKNTKDIDVLAFTEKLFKEKGLDSLNDEALEKIIKEVRGVHVK
jgi:hypothetical protein